MEDSEEIPGPARPPKEERPYETIEEREEIPGPPRPPKEESPQETMEESEETVEYEDVRELIKQL